MSKVFNLEEVRLLEIILDLESRVKTYTKYIENNNSEIEKYETNLKSIKATKVDNEESVNRYERDIEQCKESLKSKLGIVPEVIPIASPLNGKSLLDLNNDIDTLGSRSGEESCQELT